MLGGKGRYASATEGRRFVWNEIVWPAVLEAGAATFPREAYRRRRDAVCGPGDVMRASRGLASLLQKGVMYREGGSYGIHYRLIPYMRLGAGCDYATAVQEAQRA